MRIIVFLVFFVSIQTLLAQKVTITGKVVDSQTGEELPGAKITVNEGQIVIGTNMDGRYSFEIEKVESIKMKINYIGYKEVEIEIKGKDLKSNEYTKNVELVAEGTTTEEVIVTDSRYEKKAEDITISVSTLKPKAIDAQASTDLLKAMEQTSGITIMKDQPNIRGSAGYTYGSGTRVLTMLDGLPMISADRSSTNFDMLPTDNIKQVEVIKGASSVLFGAGAMGGVINVLTADPTIVPKSSIRIRHEVFGNPRSKEANWDGRSSAINTSFHGFHSRKIKNFDLTAQLDLIRNSGYKQEEFSNRGRFLFMTKYYVPGVEGLYIGLNGQVNLDSSATFIAWSGPYPQGILTPGQGFLSYQWLQRYTLDPSVAYLTKKGDRYIYRGRLFHQANAISTGQSGTATLIYNDFQFIKGLITAKDSSGFNLTALAGVSHQRNSVFAKQTFGKAFGDQIGAFLQFDIKWGRLNATAGVRYQYEVIEGDKFEFKYQGLLLDTVERVGRERLVTMREPVARFGLNYRVHKATYLRASAGQGLRSPSVAERYTTTTAGGILVLPNPSIKVEKGYTAEVGVKQLFKFSDWKGFIDLSAFTMQFENMVEFLFDRNNSSFTSFGFAAQNISNASINGLEINGYIDGKAGNWIFSYGGGATFIDPINKNGLKTFRVYGLDANGNIDSTKIEEVQFDGKDDPSLVLGAGYFFVSEEEKQKAYNDQPYTLKYRSKITLRNSFEIGYKQVTAMINHRYNSHMVNVDKIFVLAIPGAKEFREKHNKGANVFDLIISYQIRKNVLSFHIFNVLNEEYALIPGSMGAQRSFCLQYRWNF